MAHISAERLNELGKGSPITPKEEQHTMQCDYCMEGVLLGQDPDEYDSKPYPPNDLRYGEPKPPPRRPQF